MDAERIRDLCGGGQPHRITLRQGYHALFSRPVDPLTGRLGAPRMTDAVRASLEQIGCNADEYAARMERQFRDAGIWPEDE